jgi:hypothetical protein
MRDLIKRVLQENYKNTSWTDGDTTITISDVEEFLKDVKVINIPIKDIEHLSINRNKVDDDTIKRVMRSDLSYPIIIIKNGGEYTSVLDGNHRLQKAINTNVEYIQAKVLDLNKSPKVFQDMFS